MPGNTTPPIVLPHGGYRKLLTYRKSELIYLGTVVFTQRFLPKGDRTIDQMIQAARSGKQNIVEGCEASGTSKETELRLVNVAKASLEELHEDYCDYLKTRGCGIWEKDSREGLAARKLGRTSREETWKPLFLEKPAGTVANLLVSLIRQCTYLLSRQIAQLETDFQNRGGIRERMHAARSASRAANWEIALSDWLSAAETADALGSRATTAHDAIRRIESRVRRTKGWRAPSA